MLKFTFFIWTIIFKLLSSCPTKDHIENSNLLQLPEKVIEKIILFSADRPKYGYMGEFCKSVYREFLSSSYYKSKYSAKQH